MKILVAEDTPANAIILRNILEHAGHRVVLATDGVEALKALEEHPDIELLLSDVRMPEMDGLELLSAIKEHPELGSLPALMISGVSDSDTVHKAVALGCRGYILKPITEPSRVLERVRAAMDGVPPILDDPDDVREALALDSTRFQALKMEFADVLERVLDASRDGSAPSPEDSRRLEDLARQFGARRFLATQVAGGDLSRELRALLRVLEQPVL